MHELKEKTYVEPTSNGEGGVRDILGVCSIEEAAVFDGVIGGVARRRFLSMNVY